MSWPNPQQWLKELEGVAVRLTTREAAQYVNVSTRTLELWRQKGLGPKWLQLGHSIRYDLDDLNAWMQACKHGHGGGPITSK